MEITIIGKRIKNGKSYKTGKRVCGCVIHTKYLDDTVEGEAVKSFWVDKRSGITEPIEIGRSYMMEHKGGYVIKLELISETDSAISLCSGTNEGESTPWHE